jgi:S1-C subfamily serine protease
MLPLILVLPVLAIVALVIRVVMRSAPPRKQQAWHSYLMTLLIAGSFVYTITAVAVYSYVPLPPQAISSGLSDLDERATYPSLPSAQPMSGVDVAQQLKPLVMVASPAMKTWFSRGLSASGYLGAAVLLRASANGYLFATARHVAVGEGGSFKPGERVLLTTATSGWAAADIVGVHRRADLALLWMPRHEGSAEFVQPLVAENAVQEGSNIFVIGHPEGLNFTISGGMVSRLAGDIVQISAPVSPGNSGGPVYDDRGDLLGIVVGKVDRSIDPNAENLNFAVSSSLLHNLAGWDFSSDGRKRLSDFIDAVNQKSHPKTAN